MGEQSGLVRYAMLGWIWFMGNSPHLGISLSPTVGEKAEAVVRGSLSHVIDAYVLKSRSLT
jgi:hypothetical protein